MNFKRAYFAGGTFGSGRQSSPLSFHSPALKSHLCCHNYCLLVRVQTYKYRSIFGIAFNSLSYPGVSAVSTIESDSLSPRFKKMKKKNKGQGTWQQLPDYPWPEGRDRSSNMSDSKWRMRKGYRELSTCLTWVCLHLRKAVHLKYSVWAQVKQRVVNGCYRGLI